MLSLHGRSLSRFRFTHGQITEQSESHTEEIACKKTYNEKNRARAFQQVIIARKEIEKRSILNLRIFTHRNCGSFFPTSFYHVVKCVIFLEHYVIINSDYLIFHYMKKKVVKLL